MRLLLITLLLMPVLAAAGPGTNELSTRDLAEARSIYVNKCAKCHKFYEPRNYPEINWQAWMEKMDKKSRLNSRQAELLNRYLDAYRADQLPGKPQEKPPASARGSSKP